ASGSGLGDGLYSRDASRRTYRHLLDTAEALLRAGQPVIVDAAFLGKHDRDAFRRLAEACEVPFLILHTVAPAGLLRERVAQRLRAGGDASEATPAVLERQLAVFEPLAGEEALCAVTVDTGAGVGEEALTADIARRLRLA
ncbi:AAA family ATPase, partial [Methylogaea oryzae]